MTLLGTCSTLHAGLAPVMEAVGFGARAEVRGVPAPPAAIESTAAPGVLEAVATYNIILNKNPLVTSYNHTLV